MTSTYRGKPLFDCIEPHKAMLNQPEDRQKLYKIMNVENLIKSISGKYLHFNRVDNYKDFPGADQNDGKQLPLDLPGNINSKFEKNTSFSTADYYNKSRSRTFACCFSLENSCHIWENYSKGSEHGQICLVFDFGKLRHMLNRILQSDQCVINIDGSSAKQIFFINYGKINYIDPNTHQANLERISNPIEYTYLKDNIYSEEKEFRIALSTIGIGQFIMHGQLVNFPPHLQITFDFLEAISTGAIIEILMGEKCNKILLNTELKKHGIPEVQK